MTGNVMGARSAQIELEDGDDLKAGLAQALQKIREA